MTVSLLTALDRLGLRISLFSTLAVMYVPCKASVLAVSLMRMHRYPVGRSLRCLQTSKSIHLKMLSALKITHFQILFTKTAEER